MLLLQNITFAQTSIGFKNPQNIQPLLDYRLPSWGYSYLNIGFSADGSGNKKDINGFQLSIYPDFKKYYESEKNTWQIRLNTNYLYNYELDYSYYFEEDLYYEKKSELKKNSINYNLSGYWHKYLNPSLFINMGNKTYGYYNKYNNEQTENFRRFRSGSYIGIGVGRVRNVTPVIKALRINERLQRLEITDELSSEDIQKIAGIISKYGGYGIAYDRRNKYFLRDIFEQITSMQRDLTAFDYYYLSESLQENYGTRYNGWDVTLNLDYGYTFYKLDLSNSVAYDDWGSSIGFSLKSRWYKNINLEHQLGLQAELYYMYPLNDLASEYHRLTIKKSEFSWSELALKASYLWVISDRLLLDTELQAWISLQETEFDHSFSHFFYNIYPMNADENAYYNLNLSFTYFIEDNLLLKNSVYISYNPDEYLEREEVYWYFGTELVYYISRHLF